MPFIGNQPADKFLTLEKQVFTTSATDTYTLDREVSSVNDLELFLNNVRQEPTEAYTISGTTLTLASAITSSDELYCVYQGRAIGTQAPATNTVTTDMLVDANVTTAKINDDAVTNAKVNDDLISGANELTSEPADTDEFLVSDAGTLKRIDYSLIKATDGVGINQSWSDLTSSRSLSTTYTNSTGQPIMVAVSNFNPDSTSHGVKVGGSFIMKGDITSASYVTFIVPDNTTYECIGGNPSFTMWSELR